MQNTNHRGMHTSTKLAIGVLIAGAVLSGILAVMWEARNAPASDLTDTIATDTAAFALYDDYVAVETEPVDTAVAPAAEEPEASVSDRVEVSLGGDIRNGDGHYPIVMYMTMRYARDEISGVYRWRVSGKYAYKTTLENYGRGPASWFTFTGHGPAGTDGEPEELTLKVKDPDGGDFEEWSLTPTSEGFKGSILNLNTFEIFTVALTVE